MDYIEQVSPEQRDEIDKKVQKELQRRKEKRKGARVFCVRCGGGRRTPLRKWHNSYICNECWKIKEAIGEEAFIYSMKSEDNGNGSR